MSYTNNEMTMKKWINVGAIVVAFVAIVVGLCLYFFGNKPVEGIPRMPKIEQIDKDYYLVADFNSQYNYKFKLEQMIEGEYVVVDNVVTEVNSINLSKHQIGVEAGNQYRFSVCYVRENGSGNEEYSPYLNWQPSWKLDVVQKVAYEQELLKLSWQEVFQANSYTVCLIDEIGNQIKFDTNLTYFDASDLKVGSYFAYILANSENEYIFTSSASSGVEVVVTKQNQILEANVLVNNVLEVTCSQRIFQFQIFVDDELKGTMIVENFYQDGRNFKYKFENLEIILKDLKDSKVEIKTLATDFITESDLFALNIA